MSKDDIFKNGEMNREFQFGGKVADVFDDMLNRSVPCYRMVIEMKSILNCEKSTNQVINKETSA